MSALSHSDSGAQPFYPAAVDVALRDGSTIHVRPAAAEDRPAIETFLHGLSPEAIGFRFFGAVDLSWAAGWSTDMEGSDGLALVATSGPDHKILAHAAYVVTQPGRAEVAFMVADDWQQLGVATRMLELLAAAADASGVSVFTAQVMPSNHRMVQVFRDSGFKVKLRSRSGVIEVEFPTSRDEHTIELFEQREQTAAIAAVGRFLRPVRRRRDRRVGKARDRRRRTASQRALLRLPGAALSRQPAHAGDRRPEGLRHDRRGARARRPRGDRGSRRAGVRRRTRMRRRRLAGAAGDLRGIRRARRRGRGPRARADRDLPRVAACA